MADLMTLTDFRPIDRNSVDELLAFAQEELKKCEAGADSAESQVTNWKEALGLADESLELLGDWWFDGENSPINHLPHYAREAKQHRRNAAIWTEQIIILTALQKVSVRRIHQ